MKLYYVTAYLDINRDKWTTFSRPFVNYLDSFIPYITIFQNHYYINNKFNDNIKLNYYMIIYIDFKYYDLIKSKIPVDLLNKNIFRLIRIDEESLISISPLWSKLDKEEEIINSVKYKNEFKHRLHFPENNNAKYTLINHAKVDFLTNTIHMLSKLNNTENEELYICWTDFGYFKLKEDIPINLLDINKFDKDKINYTLINEVTEYDKDIKNTLYYPREVFGGFFWFGNKNKILEYQKLYHEVHQEEFLNQSYVDDDQHISLRCFIKNENLFKLWNLHGWHKALTHFQLNNN
jgi:hypothetical protein